MPRYLGFVAGPFSLAAPIGDVRRIVSVGEAAVDGPVVDVGPDDPGPRPISLAVLLGAVPRSRPQAVLAFDGVDGSTVLLSCCALRGVLDAPAPLLLPRSVASRRPGLIPAAVLDDDALLLVIDVRALAALAAARSAA